jgi:hypothetical protein
MSSCDDSYCISCRQVSCASGTSAFSLIASVPQPCRSVSSCSVQRPNHKPPRKLPPPEAISGFVPTAAGKWPSSSGSPLTRSPSPVLHRSPLALHETTLSNSNPSHVTACSVPLRLRAGPISPSRPLTPISPTPYQRNPLPTSLAVLYCMPSATLHTTVYRHSIPIEPASAATTGGFLQVAVSKARKQVPLPPSPTRASDTALIGQSRLLPSC